MKILVAAKFKGVGVPAFNDKFEKHDSWNLILDHFGVTEEYLFSPTDLPVTIVSKAPNDEKWSGVEIAGKRLPLVWPMRIFAKAKEEAPLIIKLKNQTSIALMPCNKQLNQELPLNNSNAICRFAHDHGVEKVAYFDIPFEVVIRAIKERKPTSVKALKARRNGYGRL